MQTINRIIPLCFVFGCCLGCQGQVSQTPATPEPRRSARVSDPTETADRTPPGNQETFGQPGGSVRRPPTATRLESQSQAARKNTVAPAAAVNGARRGPISARNLAALPSIEELRRLCQSLAMLDAIICPEWADRCHSFNCKWGENMMLASWRNGSGDEYYLLFCEQGAIMKGFAHESYMSPYQHGNKVWDGVLSEVPAAFGYFLKEPAFDIEATTFCVWRLKKDSEWHTGEIIFPDKDLIRSRGHARYDPDGSQGMMALFDRDPKSYKEFADDIYGDGLPPDGFDLKTISAIYAHEPMTEALAGVLNPQLTLIDLSENLHDIGYPVSKLYGQKKPCREE